ncbi:MAG TPA: hypothetical protein VFY29_03345 [Terriglobia bacterium]|nr:hypothetical protein [Terriglobia bacterium]
MGPSNHEHSAGQYRRRSLRFERAMGLAGALLLFGYVCRLAAMYMQPITDTVPIERLIRNIETLAADNPQNADILFNLGRVHAMAFAKKLEAKDPVEVVGPGANAVQPWFGIGQNPIVPPTVVNSTDAARLKEAKNHIDAAIDAYRRGVALNPKDLRAKLGYAWCIDQSGDRAKAVTAYRQVIAEAWATEQRSAKPTETTGQTGGSTAGFGESPTYLTAEAARYLLPLLDREKDHDEIVTLQDRMQILNAARIFFVTPIAIPLSDSARPETFLDGNARVSFDADGSGLPNRWTWITPDAAWLVHVPKKSYPVTSALQLFGSVTFWLFWENGYEPMNALDDNRDGILSGTELEGLGLWRDANRNGIAEEGEVKSLAEWNIVSLNCAHQDSSNRRDYVAFSQKGVTFKGGHTRPTWDVLLYSHPAKGPANS